MKRSDSFFTFNPCDYAEGSRRRSNRSDSARMSNSAVAFLRHVPERYGQK